MNNERIHIMHIEELLKKYDLDPEIFNPMKRNSKEKTEKIKEEPETTEERLTKMLETF